ncbi:ABC transporter permease [Mesoplasma chauliocola]|uniref:ABC transporter permease n=1 Tax=Mesoplasma chauliocola TaxID=216427 RepID=A0A249SNJ7_9MOLU|nr:ABC transporter permease [Mesoplasma chauliocola]ASZ09173.1 ABC transporter permease [Mesoplasma chauliocola]
MNKIMKSYLKTFFKNWLSTLFMIIFIVTLAASVIGMLATPLQVYTKMNSAQKENISYNSNFSSSQQDLNYSQDFIINYADEYLDSEFIKILNAKLWSNTLNVSGKNAEYYQDWNNFSNEEKERMTSQVNAALVKYRISANSSALELKIDDQKTSEINFYPTKEEIFQFHVKKSIELGLIDIQNFLENDDETNIYATISSIAFSTLYRIINFSYVNGINLNISSNVNINNIQGLVQIIKESYLKSLSTWNPTSIKISSYTLFNSEYSKILGNEKYQHDDRIFVFDKILNKEINKDYEIDINKNFVFKSSGSSLLTNSQTFEIKADSTKSFNNIIFDKKSNNSNKTENWGLGKIPEIVISSGYASHNNIKVGDEIEMPISQSNNIALNLILPKLTFLPFESFFAKEEKIKVKVVGIGQTFDDYVPGNNFSAFSQSIENYGFIYLNQKFINKFRNYSWNILNNEAAYNLELKIKSSDNVTERPFDLFTFKNSEKSEVKIFSNLETSWIKWSETKVAKALENLQIRIIINVVLGSIILILAFLFINFQLKKEMNETRKQLGIFKSFGYKTSELSWIFSIKTGILFFISLLLGFFISIPIQLFAAKAFENTIAIEFSSIYVSPLFLFFLFIIIPSIFISISYITTILYIKEPVLSLMASARKTKVNIKQNFLFKKVFKGEKFFNWRLRRAFVRTSRGKFYTVQTLFACASFTYILLFGAQNLMTKMLNQSFAVYNEKTDHFYNWWNSNAKLDIQEGQKKYNYKYQTETTSLDYNDYSEYENTNEYLNVNSSEEYRFKIDAVIQMTNNYFMSLSTQDKVDFLLPKSEMYFILNNMLNAKTNNLTIEDESNSSFVGTIMSFNLNSTNDQFIKAVNDIKQTGKTKEIIPTLNNSKNQDLEVLNLISMTPRDIKHIFSKDLSYIYSLKIAQIDLTISVLQEIMGKPNEIIKIEELYSPNLKDEYITQAYEKLYTNQLINKFNIYDTKQRNLNENWLLTQFDNYFETDIRSNLVALNFSNLSIAAKNVFQTTQLTDFENYDENNYMLNINNVMYDKNNEVLFDWVGLTQSGEYDDLDVYARLVNTQDNKYGSFEEMFNFQDISTSEMERFKNSSQENQGTQIVNAIIPYNMARNQNIKINDIISFKTKTLNPIDVQLRVVGINRAETIKLGSDNIWINGEDFKAKFYDENLPTRFASLYSKNLMLTFDSNTNFIEMLLSLKLIEKNSTILINEDQPITLDIFRNVFKYTNSINPNVTTNLKSIVNPYILGISSQSSTTSFVLSNLVINKATEIVDRIMLMFVLLTTVLLAIILVVIIGIIVEEAKVIILTLQALGYTDKEINWVVMGSYAIGALISFAVSYVASVIFWKILLTWIAGKFSVYIFMTVDLKTILITLTVMSVVLLFGWYASNKQVKRNPLTQITSLA